jgi:phosphoribosylglycinamide formyltransferase-1
MKKVNIAIFVSGGGTNCENLIRYFQGNDSVGCALVVSNKPDARALERAQQLGVPTAIAPKPQLHEFDVLSHWFG